MLSIEALDSFEPAPEVVEWLRETFLDSSSPLYDEGHSHLESAEFGVLWTTVDMTSKMMPKVGMVELATPSPGMSKIKKAQHDWLLRHWFGEVELNFVMYLSAGYSAKAYDWEWCSLVKHELCHCAQAEELPGVPKFRKDGSRVFAIKDHDFAGFLSTVRDFGPGAEQNVPELLLIASQQPRIAGVDISRMCGTCLRKAA
jgi:hypothetical protein